jgi:hypothetical protein
VTGTRRWALPLGALLALAVTLGAATLRHEATGQPAAGPPVDPLTDLPTDEASRAQMDEQFDRITAERAAEGGPALLLPEDQRAGWITAWNRMRDCMQAHGYHGATPVAPTFGDGRTPGPVITGRSPEGDAAQDACPFDTTLFDTEKVRAAVQAERGS